MNEDWWDTPKIEPSAAERAWFGEHADEAVSAYSPGTRHAVQVAKQKAAETVKAEPQKAPVRRGRPRKHTVI
jgi:hypothetical protein